MEIRLQILSDESLNTYGYRVLNEGIDWSRYRKNPILLRNEDNNENRGGHGGVPIGRVDNIRLENGQWVGELYFSSTEAGQKAQKLYDEGVLNAVSIAGKARFAEKGGKKYATFFEVWEISLVDIPSNPNAVAIRNNARLSAVSFNIIEEDTIVELSARELNLINKYETMPEQIKESLPLTEVPSAEEKVSLSVIEKLMGIVEGIPLKRGRRLASELREPDDHIDDADRGWTRTKIGRREIEEEREIGLARKEETKRKKLAEDRDDDDDDDDDAKLADKETKKEMAAKDKKAEEAADGKPCGLSATTPAALNLYKFENNVKVKQANYSTLNAYLDEGATKAKLSAISAITTNPESVSNALSPIALEADTYATIRELSAVTLADKRVRAALSNMTTQIGDTRSEAAITTFERLASSYDFLQGGGDLFRITWLTLFMRQLLPPDSWANDVQVVSVADREGVIWVESAMRPDIYFGRRPPVNAPNYMYMDRPRALVRYDFSHAPILWQSFEIDALAYDKRSTGLSEALRILSTHMHNYALQQIAEAIPARNIVKTTGPQFTVAAGDMPINPAAAGTINAPSLNDLIAAYGIFSRLNMNIGPEDGVLVMPSLYFTQLQYDPRFQTILTPQMSGMGPQSVNYSAWRIMPRSIVTTYNTAANAIVDSENYFTYPVDWATGAINEKYAKPVLPATAYECAVGFKPDEVVFGVGNTHMHAVPDPNSYGWKVSTDVGFAAGTLRELPGAVLIAPETTAATQTGYPVSILNQPIQVTNTTPAP